MFSKFSLFSVSKPIFRKHLINWWRVCNFAQSQEYTKKEVMQRQIRTTTPDMCWCYSFNL